MSKLDLSCNGRISVSPFVTERSVLRMAEMIDHGRRGGPAGEHARTDFKEAMTTSSAPYAFQQLINIRNLPAYDEAPNTWSQVATTEVLPDFRPSSFYSFRANFATLGHQKGTGGNLVAGRVGEREPYAEAYGYTEEAVQAAVEKRGFIWGVSLERVANDPTRAFSRVPNDMLQVGLKTDEYVVYSALVDGSDASSELQGGIVDRITGLEVPADAEISAAAIRVALREVSLRTDDQGNRIPAATSYKVVVPLGTADDVQWMLEEAGRIISIDSGNITYGAPGSGGLNRISGVIESEFIPDGAWYLVPDAGTTLRPSLVRLQLAGYTAPEVYVQGTPTPVIGGSNDPFQAFSWQDDTSWYKFRMFTNGALITQDQNVWSDGTGGPAVTPTP